MTIGERIATLRHEQGWTLRELREQIEVVTGHRISFSYLSALERGIQHHPSITQVARIAAAFDLTLCQFLHVVLVLVRKDELGQP